MSIVINLQPKSGRLAKLIQVAILGAVSISVLSPGSVVYTLGAPNGMWDASDNATWTVTLLPDAVFDNADPSQNAVPGGVPGTFEVDIPGEVVFKNGFEE